MPNYVQPDYRTPVTPGVSIQIENTTQPGAVLGNPLQLTTRTYFVDPGIDDKLDPHHAMRSGKSGT